MSLSVIIPVLNEALTVAQIIKKVLAQPRVSEVIAVDDGSSDNTFNILKIVKSNKLKILRHKQNLGKGAVIQTALRKVSKAYVIIQDGDLEYNPEEYAKLLEFASPSVAVYGSRIKGQNPHAYTRTYLGNVLVTTFANLLFGTKLTDSYTCYKLLPTKVAKSLKLLCNGFEIEAEITGKLAKRGVKIVEVPISFKPRSYEQGKKIKAKDAILGILTYIKIWLKY